MNKLFTKIASLTLGLAMAVGVGVAVGSAKASEAKADTASYVITFKDSGGASDGSYKKTAIADLVDSGSEYIKSLATTDNLYQAKSGYGIKGGGSSAKGVLVINWNTDSYEVKPTSIVAKIAIFNNDKDLKNGVLWGYNSSTSSAALSGGAELTDYTVELDGKTSLSTITVSGKVASNSRFYLHSLTINYDSSTPVCNHNWVAGTVHNPTCTEEGYTEYTCSLCQSTKHDDVVPATGHNYGDWKNTKDPDCTTAGEAQRVCANDSSHVETKVVPALGHSYVDGVCERCGAVQPAEDSVEYTFSEHYTEDTLVEGETIVANSYVNFVFTKREGGTDTKYYANGTAVRWYGGGTLVVNGASGNITKIEITYTQHANAVTVDAGSYTDITSSSGTATWIGSTNKVVFTQGGTTGHDRISVIKITYDTGGEPPVPVETWNVINNVTNAASLTVTTVAKGGNLSTTIVPETGYTVPESVTVTIGGQAVDYTYANGVVGVQGVSGDVTISGQCVKSEGHAGTKDDPFTVAEGIAKCQEIGETASGDWYVKGIISQIKSTAEDATKYKNATFNMSDDGLDKNVLIAFQVKYIDGADFTADNFKELKVGCTAVVHGALLNYKGNTPEFNGKGSSSLVSLTAPTQPTITLDPSSLNLIENGSQESVVVSYEAFSAAPTISVEGQPAYVTCTVDGYTVKVSPKAVGSEDVTIKATSTANEVATATLKVTVLTEHGHTEKDPYTVAEALQAEVSNGVYIKGVISQIDEVSVDHGNATYFISDNGTTTSQFKVFRGKYLNGENFTSEDQIKVGANVVVTGNMTVYNDENQLANGNYLVSYSEATTQYLVTFAENGKYFPDMYDAGEQITIANYHEDLVPDGKSFDHWEDEQKVSYQPGDKYTVNGAVTFTAVYVDSDWSSSFKSAFQEKFNVSYPPYINAEFAKEENIVFAENEKLCTISVSGDHVNEVKAKYVNWTSLGKTNDGQDLYKHPTADLYMSVSYVQETVVKFQVKKGAILDASSVKKDFYVGDSIDTTGLKVFYTLVDGSYSESLPVSENSWSASPSKFNTAGNVDVTVTVTGLASPVELKYQVVVLAVQVAKIEISGAMIKTSYTTEDNWNPNGFIVLATYNNGSQEYVTSNVQWSYSPEKPTAGVKLVTATASFGGVSASKDTAVTIYEVYKAENFAEDFLALVAPICNNYDGKTSNKEALKSVWYTMAERYNVLDNDEKVKVIKSASKVDGTVLERAMAFYDYACKKYGLKPFVENRTINALVFETQTSNSILPIIVIVVASLAAVTSIGLIIAYKRRKSLYMK